MPDLSKRYTAVLRQTVFLGMLLLIAFVIIRQLEFFMGSFLGAIAMYVVLRKINFKLYEKHKWKKWQSAAILVFAMTIILLGVGFLIFEITASRIADIDVSNVVEWVNGQENKIGKMLGLELGELGEYNIFRQSSGMIETIASSIFNTTYSFVVNVFLMILILYFMLLRGRSMEEAIFRYMPFRDKSLDMIKTEVNNMIYSNVIGIPLVMLSHGITSYLIFLMFGIPNAIFWSFLTALCGLIPMIGTGIVTVPMSIYLMLQGNVGSGILLLLCAVTVIANVDNVVRIILLHKMANTHPLVLIFGLILGIPLFGFWGIIFGPLLISVFLLLIKIYYMEYHLIDPSPTSEDK